MNKKGFILFMTMGFLALGTAVVTQIFYLGNLYNSYISVTLDRERARQLALSGAEIAISQLMLQDRTLVPVEEKKEGEQQKKNDDALKKKHKTDMLKVLLSVQQRWQTFPLTYENDGIDAELKICITAEQGKFDINKWYNFEKGSFAALPGMQTEQFVKMLTERLAPFVKDKNLFEPFKEFLHKQKRPFITPTEFLKDKAFWIFKDRLFYMPLDTAAQQSNQNTGAPALKSSLYLTDLLSVWGDKTIDPWTLSPSVKTVLGLDPHARFTSEQVADVIKKVDLSKINWQNDWDTYLKPLYQKEYKALPKELLPFLSSKFEPRVFSVLCYAKVGRVGQKLLAILEKSTVKKGEVITVKKLYWL